MADPLLSVFTPTHGSEWLDEAYRSLLSQTFTDWEWVLAGNNTQDPTPSFGDHRVRFVNLGTVSGVGEAKRGAVEACRGRILVELDHDDQLEPEALRMVYRAFTEHPTASLVYSRFTQITDDGEPHGLKFDASYGWDYDEDEDGFLTPRNLAPTPHNVSLIWYAPNHVRAFTRLAYDKTPGYRADLAVLDDLALISDLYQVGEFVPIDRVLYRQRLHQTNTQFKLNLNIQSGCWEMYEQNILRNVRAWTAREGLQGAEGLAEAPLDRPVSNALGYGYIRSYGELSASHDVDQMLKSASTLLSPNGLLLIMTPEDRQINEHYFRAWCSGDDPVFQESRIRTIDHDGVKWVQANLIALHEGYEREGGILHARAY